MKKKLSSTTGIKVSGVTLVSDFHNHEPMSAVYLDDDLKLEGVEFHPSYVGTVLQAIGVKYNMFVVDSDWIYDRAYFPQKLSEVKIILGDKRNILLF